MNYWSNSSKFLPFIDLEDLLAVAAISDISANAEDVYSDHSSSAIIPTWATADEMLPINSNINGMSTFSI